MFILNKEEYLFQNMCWIQVNALQTIVAFGLKQQCVYWTWSGWHSNHQI